MPDTTQVPKEALKLINGGKYTYKQVRSKGYLDDAFMDCSEFVYQSYRNAGFLDFPAINSHAMARQFKTITDPQPGDIVYWPRGHVGIVADATLGTFLGAQSSGLARASYKTGYWAMQSGRQFLRYSPPTEKK